MGPKLLSAIVFLATISFAVATADSGQLSVFSGSNYQVNYSTKDSTIQSIQANKDSLSLELYVQATSSAAYVELTLPRDLIDAKKSDGSDESFIVLVDGVFATYTETSTTSQTRTISIQLSSENKDIEVIGTSLGTTALVPQNNTQTTTPQKPTESQLNQTQVPPSHPTPLPTVKQNNTQNIASPQDILEKLTSMLNFDSSNLPLNMDKKQFTEYSIIAAIIIVIIIVIASSVKKNAPKKIRK